MINFSDAGQFPQIQSNKSNFEKSPEEIEKIRLCFYALLKINIQSFEQNPNNPFLLNLLIKQLPVSADKIEEYVKETIDKLNNLRIFNPTEEYLIFCRILNLFYGFSDVDKGLFNDNFVGGRLIIHHLCCSAGDEELTLQERDYHNETTQAVETSTKIVLNTSTDHQEPEQILTEQDLDLKSIFQAGVCFFNQFIIKQFNLAEFHPKEFYLNDTCSMSKNGKLYFLRRRLEFVQEQVVTHEVMHTYKKIQRCGRFNNILIFFTELIAIYTESAMDSKFQISYERLALFVQFVSSNTQLLIALNESINVSGNISAFYNEFVKTARAYNPKIELKIIDKLFLDILIP